jgi:hypothetical protein
MKPIISFKILPLYKNKDCLFQIVYYKNIRYPIRSMTLRGYHVPRKKNGVLPHHSSKNVPEEFSGINRSGNFM